MTMPSNGNDKKAHFPIAISLDLSSKEYSLIKHLRSLKYGEVVIVMVDYQPDRIVRILEGNKGL